MNGETQPLKTLTYNIDRPLIDVLNENTFTVSAEVIPPRNGEARAHTMERLQKVVEGSVDFVSVTRGAGGSLRGGSLPIAQAIKDHFTKTCIAHFTCRDLTPQESENLLVDHHYFGITNILALRGDPPMGQEKWEPRPGGFSYAYELIDQIRKMNQGEFLEREGFKVASREQTNFCIGCAVYPEHEDPEERIRFAKLKFEHGAQYGITQMLFDPVLYENFVSDLNKAGVFSPILPGVRILRSRKQAKIMTDRFGCSVPQWYVDALPENHERGVVNLDVLPPFIELVERLKKAGAPGVHVFVLNDIELFSGALHQLQGTSS